METKLNIILVLVVFCIIGCKSTRETMIICGKKYDVVTNKKDYAYEEDIFYVSKTLYFPKSKYKLNSFLIAGYRGTDTTNLVRSSIEQRTDSLIITTIYDSTVYKKIGTLVKKSYYRCIPNGLINLNMKGGDFIITKEL